MNKDLVQTACVVSLALVVFAVPSMSKEKQAAVRRTRSFIPAI